MMDVPSSQPKCYIGEQGERDFSSYDVLLCTGSGFEDFEPHMFSKPSTDDHTTHNALDSVTFVPGLHFTDYSKLCGMFHSFALNDGWM